MIEKGIGVVLVLFAVMVGTNSVNVIAGWMLDTVPRRTSLS